MIAGHSPLHFTNWLIRRANCLGLKVFVSEYGVGWPISYIATKQSLKTTSSFFDRTITYDYLLRLRLWSFVCNTNLVIKPTERKIDTIFYHLTKTLHSPDDNKNTYFCPWKSRPGDEPSTSRIWQHRHFKREQRRKPLSQIPFHNNILEGSMTRVVRNAPQYPARNPPVNHTITKVF
jgi:hypothetical protein